MKRSVRGKATDLSRERLLPATVIDVVKDRCAVRLSGNGKIMRGLRYSGGPVEVGSQVVVSYSTGSPIVLAMGRTIAAEQVRKPIVRRPPMSDRPAGEIGGGGGGFVAEHLLDDHVDVNAPAPSDRQALIWDDGASEWTAADVALSFLDLPDTPDAYTGFAGALVAVNGTETALEFADLSTGTGAQIFAPVVLLDQTAAPGGQASFDITDIPNGYSKIEILLQGKSEYTTASAEYLYIAFNGDTTAANYRYSIVYFNGSTSGGDADGRAAGYLATSNVATLPSSECCISIANPAGTSYYKTATWQSFVRRTSTLASIVAGGIQWENTGVIDRITLTPQSGSDFAEGTRCVVVGWKKAYVAPPGSFTELLDTPDSYVGKAGYLAVVNTAEDALEFSDIAVVQYFGDLLDTFDLSTHALSLVRVNNAGTALEPVSPVVQNVVIATSDHVISSATTTQVVVGNLATPITVFLPAAVGSGKTYTIKNINTSYVTVFASTMDTPDTIDGAATIVLNQWESVTVLDYAAHKWVIV